MNVYARKNEDLSDRRPEQFSVPPVPPPRDEPIVANRVAPHSSWKSKLAAGVTATLLATAAAGLGSLVHAQSTSRMRARDILESYAAEESNDANNAAIEAPVFSPTPSQGLPSWPEAALREIDAEAERHSSAHSSASQETGSEQAGTYFSGPDYGGFFI